MIATVLAPGASSALLNANLSPSVSDELEQIEAYLAHLAESAEVDEIVRRGARYRMLERLVARGDIARASVVCDALLPTVAPVTDDGVLLAQPLLNGFQSYLDRYPAYAGMLCYLAGEVELAKDSTDARRAAGLFAAAHALFQVEATIDIYLRQGWIERALRKRADALSRCGQTLEAMKLYAELRTDLAQLPIDLYEPILISSLALHLRTGNYGHAMGTLNAIRRAAQNGHMTKSLRRIIRGVQTVLRESPK